MNREYQARLELFVDNVQAMKKHFKWHSGMMRRLAALLYTSEGVKIDGEAIRDSYDLIKKSTGLFSAFRGNIAVSIATLLSLADDRKRLLANVISVYDRMKEEKFRASDYLVMAAYQIAAQAESSQYARVVKRSKEFYDGMKAEHRLLTGRDDYIFAAMLGLSDVHTTAGIERMERLYGELKSKITSKNGLQTLTQVLVLGAEDTKITSRVLELRDAFRRSGMRMDKEYTVSSLGVLALLPTSIDMIVDQVIDVYEFLRKQKGFSRWSVTKQELLLFSSALVAFKNVQDAQNGILTATISTSITNIIIAQQTAIAVAAASSAAASSSSSSN